MVLAVPAALAGTEKMFILKHKLHPEHRKDLSLNINGIWNIENAYLKHKWHPEHRKCLF